jgi:hypothetical protein
VILFLDFDGVLHPETPSSRHPLLNQLPPLEGVLREFPKVDVVISSTWRLKWPDPHVATIELRKHFAPDIAPRVVGVTPHHLHLDSKLAPDGLYVYHRHWEIVTWLRTQRPLGTPWVALDDRAYSFKPFLKNLMEIDPTTGLTVEDLQELRRRFKQS